MGRRWRDSDRKLFVKNLHPDTTAEALEDYFSVFGDVDSAVVIYDHDTKKSKRYGFVTFKTVDAVHAALGNPYHHLDGQRIYCNLAAMGMKRRERREEAPQPEGEEGKGEGEEEQAEGEREGKADGGAAAEEDDEPIVFKDYFTYLRDFKEEQEWLLDHPTFLPESPYQGMVLPVRPPNPMRREQMAQLLRPLYVASQPQRQASRPGAPQQAQHQMQSQHPPPGRHQQQPSHVRGPPPGTRQPRPQQYPHAQQQGGPHMPRHTAPGTIRPGLHPSLHPQAQQQHPYQQHPYQQHGQQQHGQQQQQQQRPQHIPGAPSPVGAARQGAASPQQYMAQVRMQQQTARSAQEQIVMTPRGPMRLSEARKLQQQLQQQYHHQQQQRQQQPQQQPPQEHGQQQRPPQQPQGRGQQQQQQQQQQQS